MKYIYLTFYTGDTLAEYFNHKHIHEENIIYIHYDGTKWVVLLYMEV